MSRTFTYHIFVYLSHSVHVLLESDAIPKITNGEHVGATCKNMRIFGRLGQLFLDIQWLLSLSVIKRCNYFGRNQDNDGKIV